MDWSFYIGCVAGYLACGAVACIAEKYKKKQVEPPENPDLVTLDASNTFEIPKDAKGNTYNTYLDGYDKYIREMFNDYIIANVEKWWDAYEKEVRSQLRPVESVTFKQIELRPWRPKGAMSETCYTYVRHKNFKVKVRQYYAPFSCNNLEIKITNTDITGENSNAN